MRFYEVDEALSEAIERGDSPVRVRVGIDRDGHFEDVLEEDIVDASFIGLKEAAGGTSYRGEVLLENLHEVYTPMTVGP
jgi:hypothetical protein